MQKGLFDIRKTVTDSTQEETVRRLLETIETKDEVIKQQNDKLLRAKERIAYLERMLFGSKRDRLKMPHQEGPGLFDDFFKEALDARDAAIQDTVKEIHDEAEKRRKKAKKTPNRPQKYQYSGLEERVRTVYPEGIGDLSQYDVIGKEATRILHREPAHFWVEVIERPKLRLKSEKNGLSQHVMAAPAPLAIIGGNHFAADFLAQVVIGKYRDHIPEYRQARQFADLGVKVPTSTLNDVVHAVADKLYPLYESQCEDIRGRWYLQIDEVPWRIADRQGKSRKGYAWQFHDAAPDSHGLFFYYLKGSRSGDIPRAQLKDYHGAIQTDGYDVYDYFECLENVTLLGCMAHVRRKFTEAQKSHPQLAAKALGYIAVLYELEANLRASHATAPEKAAARQEKALPIMDAMEAWMQSVKGQCTPSDLMGKALDYAYKLWPRLRRYAENGDYQIDNNAVERQQRPSVLGRKNYLFSKSDSGAVDNTVFYTLLESCDVVGINPLCWLTDVLSQLTDESTEEQIIQLLPYYYKQGH